jgi:hypothetical protein
VKIETQHAVFRIAIYLLFVPVLCSCLEGIVCRDDDLSISKNDVNTSQLRIDGYYFEDASDEDNISIYFFYNNGVFFDALDRPYEEAASNELQIDLENNLLRRSKSSWGLFRIEGNSIEVEQWRSEINGCETTLFHFGEILNDSTFSIYRIESRTDGEVRLASEPNRIYRFRYLEEKPDSTSSFFD